MFEEYQNQKDRLDNFFKEDPQILIDSYEYYLNVLKKLEKLGDNVIKDNFDKIDLRQYFLEWSEYFPGSLLLGYNYYWLSQPVSDSIIDILKKAKSKDVFSDFEILSQAEELSAIQNEKIDILDIVEKLEKEKINLDSAEADVFVEKHLDKYAYLGQYYMRGKPWTKSDLIKRLKDLINSDWQEEQKRARQFLNYKNKSLELMDKYNFDEYGRKLVRLMKKMSFATNRYDEVHAYFFANSRNFLNHIADSLGLAYVELIEMDKQEVSKYLEEGKKASQDFRDILIAREKESSQLNINGKSTIWHAKDARDIFVKEVGEDKIEESNILYGNCACQGEVEGPVVIFESVKDLDKIKKGDIMVARATVPAFVPAMERAAGIITEMGGLLSHAAIVSREMNVPCIVGVNNATKILKNGDQIKMNAKDGLIKIL